MGKKIRPNQLQQKVNFNLKDWLAIVIIITSVIIFFRDIILMKAFLWEDFLYQYYPFRNFAAVAISQGELPLWNPFTFNGTPFQADIQSALFYIPNLLLTLFVSNGQLHFYWVELFEVLHFIIAGIGMYYLMRSYKLESYSALFSAFVFMYSGFMVTHTIHQTIINHVAWLPLIVLLFRKAISEKSLLYTILCGLVLGHSVLAGFPQLSLYIFLFLLFYFLFKFILTLKDSFPKSLQIIFPALGVVVIAIAITCIQLLPTIEIAPFSARAEITYEKSLEGSLTPEQIITLFIPKFFGEFSATGNSYWGPGSYGQYWETNIYIGIAALVFVFLALYKSYRNRYVIFFGIVMLFSLLYTLGDAFFIHNVFFHYVPGFKIFRNPGRMALLFIFASSALSGFGLEALIKSQKSDASKLNRFIVICTGIGAVIWLLVQFGLFQNTIPTEYLQQIHEIVTKESNVSIILLLVISVVLFVFLKQKVSPTALAMLILLIQFVDINIFGSNYNNGTTDPSTYYSNTKQLVNHFKEEGQNEYFRINSRSGHFMVLDRNQGMVDRIFLMEGYTPLALQKIYPPTKSWEQTCDLLNAKYRIATDSATNKNYLEKSNTYLPRTYFVYDYKVITDEAKTKLFMQSNDFNPRNVALLEEDVHLTGDKNNNWSSWKANITSYKLNSISLDVFTPKDGILMLSEIFYPGWVAYIDGIRQKVLKADWNLRALLIKHGNHKVEIKFEPQLFRIGIWLSLISIGLCVGGIVYLFIAKKKAT
jgi:uncharacterized membrane protein YfhO